MVRISWLKYFSIINNKYFSVINIKYFQEQEPPAAVSNSTNHDSVKFLIISIISWLFYIHIRRREISARYITWESWLLLIVLLFCFQGNVDYTSYYATSWIQLPNFFSLQRRINEDLKVNHSTIFVDNRIFSFYNWPGLQ